MPGALLTFLLVLALIGAGPARGDHAVAIEAAKPAATTEPEMTEAFVPPPGYKPMKRGDKVVYCRTAAPFGTRLRNTECHGEVQLKEIEPARQRTHQEIERQRRICPGGTICN